MKTEDRLVVVRSQIDYRHFLRAVKAISRQPEYHLTVGSACWFLLRSLAPLIYALFTSRTKPLLITVECSDEVRGVMTFSQSGQIGNAVVLGEGRERIRTIRLLRAEIDRELSKSNQAFFARTSEDNLSLIAALKRRGFQEVDSSEYVVTLPLGILTFSWFQRKPPNCDWLAVRRLVRLERPMPSSSMHVQMPDDRVEI